jgi:hypothetical protein
MRLIETLIVVVSAVRGLAYTEHFRKQELLSQQAKKNPMETYEIKHPTPYACIPL